MLKFTLSPEMVTIIGDVLSNAPYRIARPVIDELQRQVNEQQAPPTPLAEVKEAA